MENQTIRPTGCCDPFDPAPWQKKEIVWRGELFVKDRITSLFHIPLNMGSKITKNMSLIEKAGAKAPVQLMLCDENSLWGLDIYIHVTRDVPGATMETLSGTYLTKVFEGLYSNAGRWAEEMKAYARGKGKTLKKLYFCYTTCPRCAKVYGKNYVVLFAQID